MKKDKINSMDLELVLSVFLGVVWFLGVISILINQI